MPVLAKKEEKYADVVEILDQYEDLVTEVAVETDVQPCPIHIGGDQLTRERFSGGKKKLRAAALTDTERFCHLLPITFELFHLQMSRLLVWNQQLYIHKNIALTDLIQMELM